MLLFRLTLLLVLLCYLSGYPMKKGEQSPGIDPADYPDLTNGLSDAEVESTLNDLSLEDLNELNKLLDDANNGPVNLEASLRGHHRHANKHHYEEAENTEDADADKQSVDDRCHDEDDLDKDKDMCTMHPKCNKQTTCPTTKRCSSTRRCYTPSCKSLDGLLNINLDGGGMPKMKCKKVNAKQLEDCDPEDNMCLQRNREKVKQRANLPDFSELSMDQDQNNIDSLEKLAAEAQQDKSIKHRKDLDESSADIFNLDPYKVANVDVNANEMPKLAEDEAHQPAQHEEEEEHKQVDSDVMPYERHQMGRLAHQMLKADEDKQQAEEVENNFPMEENAAQAFSQDESEAEAVEEPLLLANNNNDGDSFIAKNAREPLRYVIQTDKGDIKSENELGENRLRTDKQYSEMLNYATNRLFTDLNTQQDEVEYKRFKRNSRKTDDAPENTNESYLKKLMDSFPRDQGSQSNLNIAIREAKRIHLRVKRC